MADSNGFFRMDFRGSADGVCLAGPPGTEGGAVGSLKVWWTLPWGLELLLVPLQDEDEDDEEDVVVTGEEELELGR